MRQLLRQDSHVSLTTLKAYGCELMAGLFHVHTQGVLVCNLSCSNILLDARGSLKLSNVEQARSVPQTRKEQQLNHDPGVATSDSDKANLEMMAPELLEVSCPVYSYASDLWALVRSGHPSDGLSTKTVTWVLIYPKLPVPKLFGYNCQLPKF